MTERQRKRIGGHRALRPLVLCGAMLAPALLAVGLLVAELAGYRAAARGIAAGAPPRGGGSLYNPHGSHVQGIGEGFEGFGVRPAFRELGDVGKPSGLGEDCVLAEAPVRGLGETYAEEAGAMGLGVWGVTEEAGDDGSGPAIALVPITIAPIRNIVRVSEVAPSAAFARPGTVSANMVLEPKVVPPPYRPVRVYGRRVPPVVVTRTRPPVVAAPPPAIRRERPAPPPRRPVRRPPRPEPASDAFGCPKEWRDTWLWEVCRERMRSEA